jgi:formate hydrogenlyase transcriptional activator
LRIVQAELKDRNDRLQLLLDINNTLVSNLEFRDLLRAISVRLRELMRCEGVGVVLREAGTDVLRLYAIDFPGRPGLANEEQLVDEASPMARVFRSGQAQSHFLGDGQEPDPRAAAAGLKAYCHLPLTSGNRKIGVLSLARAELSLSRRRTWS